METPVRIANSALVWLNNQKKGIKFKNNPNLPHIFTLKLERSLQDGSQPFDSQTGKQMAIQFLVRIRPFFSYTTDHSIPRPFKNRNHSISPEIKCFRYLNGRCIHTFETYFNSLH
jgi:hypothetical protein